MTRAQLAIADAEIRYRNGAFAEAAALLVPLVAETPPHRDAIRLLGLCRLRLGFPQEAMALLARAHALAPDDVWARLHYGIALQAVGRHGDAVPMFRGAQALLPFDPAPLLNLSTSLLALGDIAGAIRVARKGRLRGHDQAESHYTLGLAYLAGNHLARAVDSFRAATKLSPDFVDGWINLGVAHYRNGDMEAAKHAMRAALNIDPGNQAAAANLGAFLRLSGNGEASEDLLRDLVAQIPNSGAARINLAADLLQEDRAEEALALLEGVVPTEPNLLQHWRLQLMLAFIRLNRLPSARAMIADIGTVPPALESLLQWRLVLLAMAEGNAAEATRQATAMAVSLVATPVTLPEHRIMGHYSLAKFWSQAGQPDMAFPHWVQGHRQLARSQPFSRAAYAEFVDATIATFDAARLARPPRAANFDRTPVFIVGMPRSGTTLIEQILDAHAQVRGAGERAALGDVFARLGGAGETPAAVSRVAGLDGFTLDLEAQRYLAELHAMAPAATRIVDKMPGNFRHLGLASLLLPGARMIACDRDPRDIGLSIFTYRFYGVHAYANDLADLGWYIGEQVRLMRHWRAALPNPMMTVRLQDWVHDFTGTLRTVLDFLDLPHDVNCERFHEVERRVRTVSRTQVREKINARGLGRWREYAHHLAPLIASLEESGALKDADA